MRGVASGETVGEARLERQQVQPQVHSTRAEVEDRWGGERVPGHRRREGGDGLGAWGGHCTSPGLLHETPQSPTEDASWGTASNRLSMDGVRDESDTPSVSGVSTGRGKGATEDTSQHTLGSLLSDQARLQCQPLKSPGSGVSTVSTCNLRGDGSVDLGRGPQGGQGHRERGCGLTLGASWSQVGRPIPILRFPSVQCDGPSHLDRG